QPYLCASHFSPSDFTQDAKPMALRFEAVPFFEDSTVKYSGMENRNRHVVKTKDTAVKYSEVDNRIRNDPKTIAKDEFCAFECLTCGQKFRQKFWLRLHLSTHQGHTNQKQVYYPSKSTCHALDQSTRIRLGHTYVRVKKHMCSTCGMRLSSKQGLNYHMLIHKRDHPFPCPHCAISFRGLTYRNNHIRNVHKMQPYACPECGEHFNWHQDWRRHLTMSEGHSERNAVHESHLGLDPAEDKWIDEQ
ncbi:hypothetical protein PMAYCL1PPCAC_08299, partial [Pristionchus mayeri]